MKTASTLALVSILALGAGAAAAPARDVSEADRARLVSELQRTETQFLASLNDVSDEQWTWKAAPDRWSIAEVAEHIGISEGTILGLVRTKIMSAPASAEMLAKTQGKDAAVLQNVPDRSRKAQAPEMLHPKGTWATREALAADFSKARAATIAFARDASQDLRAFAAPHPLLGDLDGYQWTLLVSAHTERHINQIEEVKADPGFPTR